MSEPTPPQDGFAELSPEDAEALAALVQAGLDPASVAPAQRERAQRASAILELLEVGAPADRSTRIDVTMARVLRRRQRDGSGAELLLVPDDEEALDAWVGAGYRDTRVAPSLRERARAHERLASLVASMPDGHGADAERLIESTLARVRAAIDEQSDRLRLESRRGGDRRLRLADVVSVAAVLLIGFSVVWPVFTSMRHRAQVAACLGHFNETSTGMSLYAGSNRDQLPVATASLGGGTWWDVNPRRPSSNSANLFELTRGHYVDLAALACPGNEDAPTVLWDEDARDWRAFEEVSYSYQIMFGPERPLWTLSEPTVVLTDRSPVVLKAYRGEAVRPDANSPNHGAEGQHMLLTDGSARWATSPVTEDGDNVWLPRAIERILDQIAKGERIDLRGTETPESAHDVFVGP